IPYHVLLSGTAVVEDGNGPPERITAGDIVLFPTGSAHRIHDGSGKSPKPAIERQNESLLIVESGDPGVTADLLCGRFLVGAVPDRLLRDHLPGRLVVHSTPQQAGAGNGADQNAANAASPTAGTRLTRLIELMREEAIDQGPGSETLVNHLSAALFGLTLRFATEASAPHGLLALAGRPRLQPAVIAMFDKPGEPWTLDQFAALCNMSRATFVRQFQEAIGRSATDVLTEVRMTVAGRLLIQTTRPVAEIGETVGYQSDAAFQRIFKRHTGITPARWRTSGGNLQARQTDETEMDSAES
ncbi:MAG TPA: AraC family transcriptional regulator, partial [Paraburkholderia sp.]